MHRQSVELELDVSGIGVNILMPPSQTFVAGVLSNAVAEFLTTAKVWGSKQQILVRIQDDSSHLRWGGECSYHLSQGFDQSLIQLPAVISYLQNLPNEQAEWEHDVEGAAHGISSFITSCETELSQSCLMEASVAAVADLLRTWNRTIHTQPYSEQSDTQLSGSPIRLPPTAVFLNAYLELDKPFRKSAVFERLFASWTTDLSAPSISANLIILFFLVRTSAADLDLFRHPLVLGAAFDQEVCQKHWNCASQLLSSQVSSQVVKQVEGLLK